MNIELGRLSVFRQMLFAIHISDQYADNPYLSDFDIRKAMESTEDILRLLDHTDSTHKVFCEEEK